MKTQDQLSSKLAAALKDLGASVYANGDEPKYKAQMDAALAVLEEYNHHKWADEGYRRQELNYQDTTVEKKQC